MSNADNSEMNPKVGDNICYIQHYLNPESFKLITTPITGIRIGKKATKCYSKRLNAIDIDEITSNTDWLLRSKSLILVQEPFLDVGDLKERAERWCENKGWLQNEV